MDLEINQTENGTPQKKSRALSRTGRLEHHCPRCHTPFLIHVLLHTAKRPALLNACPQTTSPTFLLQTYLFLSFFTPSQEDPQLFSIPQKTGVNTGLTGKSTNPTNSTNPTEPTKLTTDNLQRARVHIWIQIFMIHTNLGGDSKHRPSPSFLSLRHWKATREYHKGFDTCSASTSAR